MPATKSAVLIGHGMVAATHVRAMAEVPGLAIAGVLGREPRRAAAFAERMAAEAGVDLPVLPTLDAAIAACDVAIITTPPDARLPLVEALARAGRPMLMEKPVERTLAGAKRIVEVCRSADVELGIVFQHRARAASRAAFDLMARGGLGALHAVEIRVPWWRDQGYYDEPGRGTYARDGGGVLISQAIHTLDLALALAGPVARVTALTATTPAHRMEAEDFVAAGLEFANGASGALYATTAAYPGEAEAIHLHGAAGSAILKAGVLEVRYRDGRTEMLGETAATGGGADPMAFTHAWHRDVIADFLDAVTAGRPPMVSGHDALAVHALIEALVAAGRTGRAVAVAPVDLGPGI